MGSSDLRIVADTLLERHNFPRSEYRPSLISIAELTLDVAKSLPSLMRAIVGLVCIVINASLSVVESARNALWFLSVSNLSPANDPPIVPVTAIDSPTRAPALVNGL